MKKKAFTLLEIIISITIFFVLLVVIISLYTKMLRLKYTIQAKQSLIQNSYNAMEKINLILKDYTVDYEEYFNRQNVWCSSGYAGLNFVRDTLANGHCDNFTAYGNSSFVTGAHALYYCSSFNPVGDPQVIIPTNGIQHGSWCQQPWRQAFGEYYWQFWDIKKDSDNVPGALGDDDDQNMMRWPNAILDPTHVKELYLISQDGKQRILLRRALVESGDWNKDLSVSGDSEHLYTLQILKLRWFDAGNHHNFDTSNSSGVYDSNVDTWACDYAQGFICHGSWLWLLYSGYALPVDANDGRVNLFDQDLTVSDRNLIIYPTKNPEYALAPEENATQLNPYFTVSLTNKLYGKIWYKKLWIPSLEDFQLTLQTSFSTKTWYTK